MKLKKTKHKIICQIFTRITKEYKVYNRQTVHAFIKYINDTSIDSTYNFFVSSHFLNIPNKTNYREIDCVFNLLLKTNHCPYYNNFDTTHQKAKDWIQTFIDNNKILFTD